MNLWPDVNYWVYLAQESARFHRARMLHYRAEKRIFERGTKGYKAASRLEIQHAFQFWEMMKEIERLKSYDD